MKKRRRWQLTESEVETVQRVQLRLTELGIRDGAIDAAIDTAINVCAISRYIGRCVEAWMAKHDKAWDDDVDFTTIVDTIAETFHVQHDAPYSGHGEWLADNRHAILGLVNTAMQAEAEAN